MASCDVIIILSQQESEVASCLHLGGWLRRGRNRIKIFPLPLPHLAMNVVQLNQKAFSPLQVFVDPHSPIS